jgi:hypothetical protein
LAFSLGVGFWGTGWAGAVRDSAVPEPGGEGSVDELSTAIDKELSKLERLDLALIRSNEFRKSAESVRLPS